MVKVIGGLLGEANPLSYIYRVNKLKNKIMNRNEQQMYSDITSIRKSLEKIANALDNNVTQTSKDIPGFEGTLDALDNLCNVNYRPEINPADLCNVSTKDEDYGDDVHNDYLNDLVQGMNQIEYLNFHNDMSFSFASNDSTAMSDAIYELEYEECLGAIQRALLITGDSDYIEAVECSNLGLGYNKETKDELAREYVKDLLENESLKKDDPYTYDNDLNEYVNGIKNDSDHDIRSTAAYYEGELKNYLVNQEFCRTKKDCILDYVTNEFGLHGARYTDIIKFAYYLGASNAPKYDNSCRGYYAMAFNTRFGGHLVQGGKDYLVKGINKEGKERYYVLSYVDQATDYYKRIS